MRKGQSSVEFLVTYGWAILVLVIVVGVLLGSGMLSPTYLISEECAFGNNLRCNFALFSQVDSTHIILEVFNGFPYAIEIRNLELQTQDGMQQFSGFATGVNISSGDSVIFEGDLSGREISEGEIERFIGNLTYVSCAPELGPGCSDNEHIITGRVVGRIIPQ